MKSFLLSSSLLAAVALCISSAVSGRARNCPPYSFAIAEARDAKRQFHVFVSGEQWEQPEPQVVQQWGQLARLEHQPQ